VCCNTLPSTELGISLHTYQWVSSLSSKHVDLEAFSRGSRCLPYPTLHESIRSRFFSEFVSGVGAAAAGQPFTRLRKVQGPNGAGKTTTINCLTGIIPPTAGDALINGDSPPPLLDGSSSSSSSSSSSKQKQKLIILAFAYGITLSLSDMFENPVLHVPHQAHEGGSRCTSNKKR
jgi:hypothetical protein